MQAYGADCLHEHGKLLIVGKSIEEYPDKKVPFREKGWFQDRMTVKMFKAITEILSPTSAKVRKWSLKNRWCDLLLMLAVPFHVDYYRRRCQS